MLLLWDRQPSKAFSYVFYHFLANGKFCFCWQCLLEPFPVAKKGLARCLSPTLRLFALPFCQRNRKEGKCLFLCLFSLFPAPPRSRHLVINPRETFSGKPFIVRISLRLVIAKTNFGFLCNLFLLDWLPGREIWVGQTSHFFLSREPSFDGCHFPFGWANVAGRRNLFLLVFDLFCLELRRENLTSQNIRIQRRVTSIEATAKWERNIRWASGVAPAAETFWNIAFDILFVLSICRNSRRCTLCVFVAFFTLSSCFSSVSGPRHCFFGISLYRPIRNVMPVVSAEAGAAELLLQKFH